MKLKNTELHQLCIAMAKLYGVIHSDEIIKVLKTYYPEINKDDIMHYLRMLDGKYRFDYFVARITDERGKFFLVDSFIERKTDNLVIQERHGKPLYIPDSVDELLKYRGNCYMVETEIQVYNNFRTYLYNHLKIKNNKKKDIEIERFIEFTYMNIKNGSFLIDKDFNAYIQEELNVDGEKDVEFQKIFFTLIYFTKLYTNKGYSQFELDLISKGMLEVNGPKPKEKKTKKDDGSKLYYYEPKSSTIIPIRNGNKKEIKIEKKYKA